MAKGIRVNQLAKELGVESKAILAKCREEGLGDKVPNHMSVLSVGLSETPCAPEMVQRRRRRHGLQPSRSRRSVEVKPEAAALVKKKHVDRRIPSDEHGAHDDADEVIARHLAEPHRNRAGHRMASIRLPLKIHAAKHTSPKRRQPSHPAVEPDSRLMHTPRPKRTPRLRIRIDTVDRNSRRRRGWTALSAHVAPATPHTPAMRAQFRMNRH